MMHCVSRHTGEALLCLGRLGDVTAALPIAHELSYQSGKTIQFIVSRHYAPLLEACSYIERVPVDVPFNELTHTVRRYKSRYSKLIVAQIYSKDTRIVPITESFVTDAWHRAGMLPKFGLPLVLDKRNHTREQQILNLVGDSSPFIVVHRGGVSSPYPYKNELLSHLNNFPARIIDITNIVCSKPQDLLALFERASLAILADSFPLHLSFACRNLPVIALQTDKPNNWFGAPPRPNWIAQYRYEESKTRLEEISELARATVEKPVAKHFTFPSGAYNASVLDSGSARLFTWRQHPNSTWETRLHGATEHNAKPVPIVLPSEFDGCSQEDARLFLHNGTPHVSYTLSKFVGKQPRCIVGYGELSTGHDAWRVLDHRQINYGRNDWSSTEKNHVFWSQDGKLFCLYSNGVVLEVDGAKVVAEHRSPPAAWPYGEIRGDTVLPYDGKLLRIFHSCMRYPSRQYRYFIGASFLDRTPPFRTLKVSVTPLFAGDAARPKTAHHSKHHIVFTCGATLEGDTLILPVAFNDDCVQINRIPIKQLGL